MKIMSLRAASIAGIVYIAAFILSGVFYLIGNGMGQGRETMFHLFAVAISVLVAAHFCFLWGFVRLGGLVKKKALQFTAIILMGSDVLTAAFFLLLATAPQAFIERLIGVSSAAGIFALLRVALSAAINLAFGITLFSLKSEFGKIAVAAGVLSVVMSVFMGSIMVAPLALIMMIPVTILEIILLYRAAKKYQV